MNIIITGVTSGFGHALAKLSIKNGHSVLGIGRRTDRLRQLQNELGKNFYPFTVDVSRSEDVANFFCHLPESLGAIDVLVNNAGLALGLNRAQDAELTDWETMVQTNVMGLLFCTKKALEIMKVRNQGHIINVGSVAAEFPYPGGNVYGATKAFVHQLSQNLKADLLGTNIRVTNIEPGMCETEFSLVRYSGDKEKADKVYQNMTPLSAHDVAETIYWAMTRPAHVNVNLISLMPVDQGFSPFAVNRKE